MACVPRELPERPILGIGPRARGRFQGLIRNAGATSPFARSVCTGTAARGKPRPTSAGRGCRPPPSRCMATLDTAPREATMAYSSILGADTAPHQPSGRDSESLGPSDNSDTGSDAAGTFEAHADSDAMGTGERGSVSRNDPTD